MLAVSRRRVLLAAASAVLLVAGAVWLWRGRAASTASLVEALPPGDGTVLYLDFAALRRSGILDQIAGSPAIEEADYRSFVDATGFDYRRDLDGVAAAFLPQGNFFIARGRFAFDRLSRYAQISGGRCIRDVCSLAGSSRERQISFQLLDSATLAVGVSASDPFAVTSVKLGSRHARAVDGIAWLLVPRSALHPRPGLPGMLNLNLAAMAPAIQATLSLGGSKAGPALTLEADCDDEAAAVRVRQGLRGGEFQTVGKQVRGHWPLPVDWWKSLTG